MNPAFVNKVFELQPYEFPGAVAAAYQHQFENNALYHQFCKTRAQQLPTNPDYLTVPFLPVGFFKTHEVLTGSILPKLYFESSGTSQQTTSRHLITDLNMYETAFTNGFRLVYGAPQDWCILGLLPSYLERKHSSLVYMVQQLMTQSQHPGNGFYLQNFDALHAHLQQQELHQQNTLLIGVTYALLDFAEQYPIPCTYTTVMETGGMKGRREELTRDEVHRQLKEAFGVSTIHSEYGMTELLSQAYATGDGRFRCPPWMKVLVREEDDPLQVNTVGKGALNIIDLANIHSCCFIATDDVGEVYADGSFQVLGRLDNSDIRGCSLLAL